MLTFAALFVAFGIALNASTHTISWFPDPTATTTTATSTTSTSIGEG